MKKHTMDRVEQLLEKPCWVMNFLPKQVPAQSGGQYFTIEHYFRTHYREQIANAFFMILLKVNCYEDISFSFDGDSWTVNPHPEELCEKITACVLAEDPFYVLLNNQETLLMYEGDDANLVIYNPNEQLLNLLSALAPSQGFYVWKP